MSDPLADPMAPSLSAVAGHPHRRRNALTGEWILVSPHRTQRPWQGQVEGRDAGRRPTYDPACYLCPTNVRAGHARNPDYSGALAFDNDFPALTPEAGGPAAAFENELCRAEPETGVCRVICFSPRHDLSLPDLDRSAIRSVVDLWVDEFERLAQRPDIAHVQIFENKGEVMGCSNPHPHGQIWAQRSVPREPAREIVAQREHYLRHGRTLLEDYLSLELRDRERLVTENDGFVAVVPFWAVWPFETLVISRRPVQHIGDLSDTERDQLTNVLKELTTRYDNLFETSFPYSSGFHQAPTDGIAHPECHLHIHFYPPLLRSATIRKFFVGYEMLGEPQRDLTAEAAAGRLRATPSVLYRSVVGRVL